MSILKTVPTFALILGIVFAIQFTSANNCKKLASEFSHVTETFLGCAIANAEPVKYCRECGNGLAAVIIKYNKLYSNETCQAKYFNQDRIKIVEMAYSNIRSIWDAGSCSNCYDWVDNSYTQNLSEITTTFFSALTNFTICLNESDSKTVCTNCVDNYNRVNDLYKNIQKDTKDNFCFDIRDAMNKTRLNWSHNLGCCKDRKTSLTAFIVTSVIISVLIPLFFYSSFMFFGWRREQLDEPLVDSDIQPSTHTLDNGTNGAIESNTVPAIASLIGI